MDSDDEWLQKAIDGQRAIGESMARIINDGFYKLVGLHTLMGKSREDAMNAAIDSMNKGRCRGTRK